MFTIQRHDPNSSGLSTEVLSHIFYNTAPIIAWVPVILNPDYSIGPSTLDMAR